MADTDVLCSVPRRGDRANGCILAPNHNGDHGSGDGQTWHNYGPLQTYEVTWVSGHAETVHAHQVMFPPPDAGILSVVTVTDRVRAIRMHAEIDGRWQVMLSAREEDIRTVRNVTGGEQAPA